MTPRTIALLVASQRTDSLNVRLARAIEKLAPPEFSFRWIRIDDLPFYTRPEGSAPIGAALVADIEAAARVHRHPE